MIDQAGGAEFRQLSAVTSCIELSHRKKVLIISTQYVDKDLIIFY